MVRRPTGGAAALLVDFDRTLTDARLRPVPEALDVLQRVRRRGVATVLVTGRRWHELRGRVRVLATFDRLVLEGGGLVGRAGRFREVEPGPAEVRRLARWLRAQGVAFDGGRTCLSLARSERARLSAFPGRADIHLEVNRNRLDVTPKGVHKGVGARRALAELGIRRGPVWAIGDADNDLALFRAADYRVAVANATPRLRRHADARTRWPGGRGLADFLRRTLLEDGRR